MLLCWLQGLAASGACAAPIEPSAVAPALPADYRFVPGEANPEVPALRRILVDLGALSPVQASGRRYDKYVIAAIRTFQLAHGLRNTGIAADHTIPVLNAVHQAWLQHEARTTPQSLPDHPPPAEPTERAAQSLPVESRDAAPPRSCAPPKPILAAVAASPSQPLFDPGSLERLRHTRELYAAIVDRGGWNPLPANLRLSYGQSDSQVPALRQRLAAEGYLAAAEAGAGACYDEALDRAVRAFQAANGLPERHHLSEQTVQALNVPARERLAAIEASLARLAQPRFAQFAMDKRHVVVNLASASAQVIDGDEVLVSQRVGVGKPSRPSPQIVTHITGVKFAPSWTVPFSIARTEIAPLVRKDPTYLDHHHMRVEDTNHHPIDARDVDWDNTNYNLREEPGPHGSLGRIKVEMPNGEQVYMHDTPGKLLFQRLNRAASHGCVRLSDPAAVAAAILTPTFPQWTLANVRAEMAAAGAGWDATFPVELPKQAWIPVAWIYLTAWTSRDGVTHFAQDLYGLDKPRHPRVADNRPVAR